MVSDPVGLLNVYEYYKSYEKLINIVGWTSAPANSYLYVKDTWWLLNPTDASNVLHVYRNGEIRVVAPTIISSLNGVGPRP